MDLLLYLRGIYITCWNYILNIFNTNTYTDNLITDQNIYINKIIFFHKKKIIIPPIELQNIIISYFTSIFTNLYISNTSNISNIPEICTLYNYYIEFTLHSFNYSIFINDIQQFSQNKHLINDVNTFNEIFIFKIILTNETGIIEDYDITPIIKKYKGPFFDYYKSLKGCSYNLTDILFNIDISKYNYILVDKIIEQNRINIHKDLLLFDLLK